MSAPVIGLAEGLPILDSPRARALGRAAGGIDTEIWPERARTLARWARAAARACCCELVDPDRFRYDRIRQDEAESAAGRAHALADALDRVEGELHAAEGALPPAVGSRPGVGVILVILLGVADGLALAPVLAGATGLEGLGGIVLASLAGMGLVAAGTRAGEPDEPEAWVSRHVGVITGGLVSAGLLVCVLTAAIPAASLVLAVLPVAVGLVADAARQRATSPEPRWQTAWMERARAEQRLRAQGVRRVRLYAEKADADAIVRGWTEEVGRREALAAAEPRLVEWAEAVAEDAHHQRVTENRAATIRPVQRSAAS